MTNQEKLDDAESALHELIVGRSATLYGDGGEQIRYTPADESKLRRYISELKALISGASSGLTGGSRGAYF